ncbi:NfeD family protein [Luteolibacter algae]|uniref:NfeD family protein n=1 Tax=Luteolibacter algae TaxID=454151 RepID=A0ABW5DA41_9BACT
MTDFLNTWWQELNFNLQIFYGIGIIAISVLIIQMIMSTVLGVDSDLDVGDFELGDHDSGLSIFSVRGVTAFFVGFGWTGVICTEQGLGLPITLLISGTVGVAMMGAIFMMMRSFMKLQSSGTLNYANAIGQTATVYVTIPPSMGNGGQIETLIQGRLVTAQALQKGETSLSPGTKVKVIGTVGPTVLLVENL